MNTNVIPFAPYKRPQTELSSSYHIYINTLAQSGRKSMISQLRKAIRLLGFQGEPELFAWHDLSFEQVHSIRASMVELGCAVNSINLTLAGLRGVTKAAFNLGYIDADQMLRITSVKNTKGDAQQVGKKISRPEIQKLIKAAKSQSHLLQASRDHALIMIGFGAGLRCSEICNLQIGDYKPHFGLLCVRQGKGRRNRQVYVARKVICAIDSWIQLRGTMDGPLLTSLRKVGKVHATKLSTQGVTYILSKIQQRAKVSKFTPHDMRRTFITDLLEKDVDINTVRQLAGHSDISTTTRYDCRDISWQKNASQSIQF
ncbi:Phage integrase [gamma proteobacterium IMCC1989]|nr:Phage integrase [gamma proteobacterium IMCC1989]